MTKLSDLHYSPEETVLSRSMKTTVMTRLTRSSMHVLKFHLFETKIR